jgi:hypothetical protein
LHLEVGGWRPYGTLRAHVPGFDEVRSPYRAAALVQVALVPLAALGVTRLGRSRSSVAVVVTVCVALAAAAENLSRTPLVRVESDGTPVVAWLKSLPPGTAVAHVPFPAGVHVSDYELEARRMLAQTAHHKPLVNGYSGYFPVARGPNGEVVPSYTIFQLAMAREFPSYRLLCTLTRSLRARVLVADRPWLARHRAGVQRWRSFLRPAYHDDDAVAYRLHIPRGEC